MRTRGKGDMFTRVARGVGNPVPTTEKVKKAAYAEYNTSGEFAPGKMAQLPKKGETTQFAEAQPSTTTGPVGATPTTPAAAAGPGTQMAQGERSLYERVFPSASAQPPAATTPGASSSPATPANMAPGTPRITTDISGVSAPATAVSREVRNPLGIYNNPRPDVMNQFGYRKDLTAGAMALPQTNVPAATATITPTSTTTTAAPAPTPAAVTALPQQLSAPGPAPDISGAQVSQIKNQVQAIAEMPNAASPTPRMEQVSRVTQTVDHDQSLKMMQSPADTPSMYRAFARSFGNETSGVYGESHFDYGK